MIKVKVSELVNIHSFFRKMMNVDLDFSFALKVAEYYKVLNDRIDSYSKIEERLIEAIRESKKEADFKNTKQKHDEFLETECEIDIFTVDENLINRIKCRPLEAETLIKHGFINKKEKDTPPPG